MRVSKTIRKVAAIGAGATMLGATMFGAMAADLASYPKPFVQDGKYNALIVFGDTAKTSDVIGAVDIATNLAYAMKQTAASTGTATTTVDSGAAIETSGQKLYKGDIFNTTKQSFTATDLPDILKKQTISDTDGTTVEVAQAIKTLVQASVTFDKTSDNLDDPAVNIPLYGNQNYNYTAEMTFTPAVDILKLKGKKITLYGKEYTFSSNAAELNASNTDNGVVLYGGGIQKIMTAGDTATVDVSGTQAVVNVVGVNTDTTTAMITVNGESKQMSEGNTETLGGVRVYLKQIFSYTVPAKQGAAELFIGTDKLILRNGQAAKKASSDIDGTRVGMSISSLKTSKISVYVTPYSTSGSVKYLKMGDSFTDPVFGSFKWAFTGITPGLEDAGRDVIKVYPSAEDRIALEFTNKNGQKYSTVILNGSVNSGAGLVGLGDGVGVIHTNVELPIKENDKFLLGTNEYTHIYTLKQIALDSSSPKIKVQDAAQGSTTEELTTTYASGKNTATLSVDGYSYNLDVYPHINTSVNISSGIVNVLTTKNGAAIRLPVISAGGGVYLDVMQIAGLNASKINITEETSYNGGTFTSGGVTLGSGDIVLNLSQASDSSNYDMQIQQPTGAPSGEALSWQNVGTSYDRRAITRYGTYLKYNTNSDVVTVYYPKDAANYQVFLAPTLATVKTTGAAGTSVTINEIAVGAAKLSSDALAADPDLSMNNYILVGGPCVNAAAAKIMGATAATDCAAGFEAGKAKVKLYENAATGKVALLVAGYSAEDTTRAARAVKTGKLATVAAAAKEVSVTTVTDTPTLTVVTQ